MKRSFPMYRSVSLLALAASAVACERNLPVDDPNQNPGILAPTGIIQGTATYIGPAPCLRNGQVEGALVLLLFDYNNPPPPEGLATTAINFATVPGERLFSNYPRPATGPGSVGNPNELCPSVNSQSITVSTTWSMQQVNAGRYQVRAFYSRQNRFNPLFDYTNLPLAGDVPGGAIVDPRAAVPKFISIDVGVPVTVPPNCIQPTAADKDACDQKKAAAAAGALEIPPEGFVRTGVPVALGNPLRSNTPYFSVDYSKSVSYDVQTAAIGMAKDLADNYAAQHHMIAGADNAALGMVAFPQDHVSTSRSDLTCAGTKDPNCDIFKYAQPSFPAVRFNYGFPGDAGDPTKTPADAWIAKNAKPANPFDPTHIRPYYGLDPHQFASDIPTSDGFMLTRVFTPSGQPDLVRDNEALETLAQVANLFPLVVLSKLAEDGEGNILQPPQPQTDPIVIIQGITLRDWTDGPLKGQGSMKASSQGQIAGGALTNAAGEPDPAQPLNQPNGNEVQQGFTALIRPATVCTFPEGDLRGTLVTPVAQDPNPLNDADKTLVERARILAAFPTRVKDVKFGCLPPGHYAINVVYPSGQAWSFPNLTGHCSFDTKGQPTEDCFVPPQALPQDQAKNGFAKRPLLQSQMLFQTNPDGSFKKDAAGNPVPQVVEIRPSPRCMSQQTENTSTCNVDNDCALKFSGACMMADDGKKHCDLNGDGKISTKPVWVNNPVNEDTSLDVGGSVSPLSANGVLDMGEDVNKNGKLDMHIPNVCVLPSTKFVTLPAADQAK